MPTIAMCTLGKVNERRPLPSFSVMAMPPISEIRKLPPVIPISASVYFSRIILRAMATSSSALSVCFMFSFSTKSLAISSLLMCMAGVTIW